MQVENVIITRVIINIVINIQVLVIVETDAQLQNRIECKYSQA